MAKFKPLTREAYNKFILHRHQYIRATRRGRIEPLILIFYGAVLPLVSLINENPSGLALQVAAWLWGAIAVIALLILAFGETDFERARRYEKWLLKYHREIEEAKRDDDRDAPARRSAYEELLLKHGLTQKDHDTN